MSDVINGVPRELLERVNNHLHSTGDFDPTYPPGSQAVNESAHLYLELSALLSDQPQASAAQSAPAGEREAACIASPWAIGTHRSMAFVEGFQAGASWQRTQSAGVPDVSAMARVLSDRSADACNIDRTDNWAIYGQEYIEDVQAMLAAAPAQPAALTYKDDPRSPSELSLSGCNCVRFGEGNPHWPCKIHPAQPAAQRDWPDDEIVAAWKWCEENGGTPAEFLSHSLLVKRSRVLGRPLTWREAIELTAITTNMPDEERDKLLAIDDEPDAAAQDQGEVQRLREALEFYARGDHLLLADQDAWDTCEPNWLRDFADTASVEDGSLARAALAASTGQEVEP